MFARLVTLQPRLNMVAEFPRVIEKEILPLLRKQKGFLDELVLVTPNKTEINAISLWEGEESANTFHKVAYPEIVKILDKYTLGIPVVKNFEVEYTTFEKFAKFATV